MPTLVANAQGSVGPGTPLTVSITVPSGSNQVLVVFVSCVDNTDKMASGSVTYNSTSMGAPVVAEGAGDRNFAYGYVLAAPASGAHNVVITPASSSYLSAHVEVWDDVHQTTPVLSSDHYSAAFPPLSPTPLTRTISIPAGHVATDLMCVRNSSATVTPAGVAIGTNAGVATISTCKASYTAGAASGTSWTFNQNNATSITMVLQPPAASDTTAPTLAGSITIGTVTSTSIQMSWPAGADNVAVTSYEVSKDGGTTWVDTGSTTTSGTFTGLVPSTSYELRARAKDAAGNVSTPPLSATQSTSAGNTPPSWTGTPSAMSAKRGQALAAQDITSLVTDTDALTYTISGAPTGVSIGSSTGIISGTPTGAPGTYSCTVSANDGANGPVASSAFNITVTQAALALNAAGYEFGDGNSPATMAVLASTSLQVAVYPLTEWPPASAIASVTVTTGTNGRLADLTDDDLLFGSTYRVIARNAADGQTWAWTMAAT